MTTEVYETLKPWILRVSLGIACLIGLLSLLAGIKLFSSVVRAGVTCLLFYLLFLSIITVFQKTALPEPETEAKGAPDGRGGIIDFSVGDQDLLTESSEASKLSEAVKSSATSGVFPGQVDPSINAGLGDGKRAAEVVRRMGWE